MQPSTLIFQCAQWHNLLITQTTGTACLLGVNRCVFTFPWSFLELPSLDESVVVRFGLCRRYIKILNGCGWNLSGQRGKRWVFENSLSTWLSTRLYPLWVCSHSGLVTVWYPFAQLVVLVDTCLPETSWTQQD